jgi:hypothetical protein
MRRLDAPATDVLVAGGVTGVDDPSAPELLATSPEQVRLRPIAWDGASLLCFFVVMLGATTVFVARSNTVLGDLRALRWGLIVGVVMTCLWLTYLTVRERPGLAGFFHSLSRVWRAPPRGWAAFLAGAIVAVPLLSLYAPVLLYDSDSARLVAAVTNFQGLGYFRDTQANFLPFLVLRPIIAVGGLAGAKLFAIVSVQITAGVTAYITSRITASMWASVAAALALVSMAPILERAGFLPMYPAMLALGYLGCWLSYRAISEPASGWRTWLPAGLCLAASPEAQAVGALFLPVPVFLLIFARNWRPAARSLAGIYGTLIVVSIPRLVLNISEGGLSQITGYRTDYWITEGYVSEIQKNFWHYIGVSEPLNVYLHRLPYRFRESFGHLGWILLLVALLAWLICCKMRVRLFAIVALGYFLAAIIVKQIPPFPRYYSPLFPGVAILFGVAVGTATKRLRGFTVPRVLGGIVSVLGTAVLAQLLVVNLTSAVHVDETLRAFVSRQPYADFAAIIKDGKGVIGVRSSSMNFVGTSIDTWGDQFLTEAEYVTYLTWPSDQKVIEMMKRHNIGWIFITSDRKLETAYNDTWLEPHYGLRARQVEAVAESPNFCLRGDKKGYLLYQLGSCG